MAELVLYNAEAEQGLLSAFLVDPALLDSISISAQDYYLLKHQEVMRSILTVRASGGAVDYITVTNDLKSRKMEDFAKYVLDLLDTNGLTYNAETYARIVREKAQRRRMMQAANALASAAVNEAEPMEDKLPGIITAIANGASVRDQARPLADYISALYDNIDERAKNPADVWGLKTGFPGFDKITGGLQQGEVMIISGVPGVGKTRIAIQMAVQMAGYNPGAIYELEMGGLSIARRMMSGETGISTRAMKTGRVEDGDWPKLIEGFEKLSALPIWMSDAFDWDTTRMRADLARLKAQHGIRWFVVDYLFLLQDGAGLEEIERTALASAGLKRICKDLDLACIAVHSMNKMGMVESGVPQQGNLRGSGQVVYDADLITFLVPYNDKTDPHPIPVPMKQRASVVTMWFGKGRELEDPKKFIDFKTIPGSPFFGELERENKW